jgi:hypothetical protein
MDLNNRCAFPDALDPHKRVRYSHGLVLGVGELSTEQNFLLGLHYSHNRRLHGYGTGAGLGLEIRELADGPECVVNPGWGVDPRGRDICVHEAQCAKLNQWLLQEQQAGDFSPPLDTSGVSTVQAYVVLCYHECETDSVPIPVGPCLSLDKAMVPSRIEQSFELRLSSQPPLQAEEDAMRRLGDILSRVTIATGDGGATDADEIVAEVRSLLTAAPSVGSIPSVPNDFVLDPAFAEEILRAALRVFITEVRPQLVPDGGACLNGPRDEACLLLGRLVFDVTTGSSGLAVVPGTVIVDERRRPLLFSSRLLQEAMLSNMLPGLAGNAPTAPLIVVTPGAPLTATMADALRGSVGPANTSSTIITLSPGSASPATLLGTAAFAGNAPSVRFRRNTTATFTFTVPPGTSSTTSVALRLQWAFTKAAGGADVSLTWEASLRLQGANDDLSFPSTGTPVEINATTSDATSQRLLSTPFVSLPRGATAQPILGFLTLTLRSTAALPATTEIHLLLAELALTPGGAL